jgi:asparagine synthase (glutamine-hydrolysing)
MSADAQASVCGRMSDALAHRGPDDRGVWTDAASGIALGHRRLSILDLSPLGHQPMASQGGRYVISYNGEIYNFAELRDCLSGHRFRGTSDTEVLLAAFEQWGVEGALPRLDGMFALALWDRENRAIWLARDRFGEKPLYFGRVGRVLVFGSELKAIRCFPGFVPAVDRGALTQFLRFGYVPTQSCIYRGIRKLPPASYHRIAMEADIDRAPSTYFRVEDLAREGLRHPFAGTDEDAVVELEARLRRAVRSRMASDVPLGAFLSGGIDSSTVVAMMQSAAMSKVRTFTIGSDDAVLDEAKSAARIAAHLGTDHTELYVSAAAAQSVIPRLPAMYDEPFADSSQIPTFLVSELARTRVTVALSGDGGDELFGGYNWYFAAAARRRRLMRVPSSARSVAASSIARLGRSPSIDLALASLVRALPPRARARVPGDLLQKLVSVLSSTAPGEMFLTLQSAWPSPSDLTGVPEPPHEVFQTSPPELEDFVAQMMCTDARAYLPDDILVKVDRASMAVSLEARVPMLDPEVVRFAWSLPRRLKLDSGMGKVVLRRVLARHVPPSLFDGPKKGFAVPIGEWLRGPLRDWAEALLSAERVSREGLFDPNAIRRKWAEHLSGMRGSAAAVWSLLMFQAWYAEWGMSVPRQAA